MTNELNASVRFKRKQTLSIVHTHLSKGTCDMKLNCALVHFGFKVASAFRKVCFKY